MLKNLLAAACVLCSFAAVAGENAGIAVTDAWMRASLGQVPTTAAYFRIENKGAGEDQLVGVSTPVAGMSHLHESVADNGIMQMRAVEALTVKPGESVQLNPGGLHVMVMNLKAPLKAGEKVPLVLRFEKAGEIKVEAEVRGLNDVKAPVQGHEEHTH
jgi:periplasmic copper chaperone A